MMKKIHIYRRNHKIQVYTIISVTFKLHTFCNILQINKLYIVSTETAGTPTGHEARFVFVFVVFVFSFKVTQWKTFIQGISRWILNVSSTLHLCDTLDSHFHRSETGGFLVRSAVSLLWGRLSHTDADRRTDTRSGPCEPCGVLGHALPHKCPRSPLSPTAGESGPGQQMSLFCPHQRWRNVKGRWRI